MDTDLRRSPTLTNRLRAGLISLAEVRVMAFIGDEEARRLVPTLPSDVTGIRPAAWWHIDQTLHAVGDHETTWMKSLCRLVTDCPDPQRLGVVVAVAAAEAALPVWAKQRAGNDTIPYTGDYEADEHIYWEQVAWRAQEPQAVIEAARAWLREPTESNRLDWLRVALPLVGSLESQWAPHPQYDPWEQTGHAARLTDVRPAVCTALLTELRNGH